MKISKNEILKEDIKVGDIFPNNPKEAKKVYKELIKQYHPDNCKDLQATEIIQKIQMLYTRAEELFQNNLWEKTNYIKFISTTGKQIFIHYQYHHVFELGEYFVCNKNVIYSFDFSKKKYYNNYIQNINNLRHENDNMKKVFSRIFPKILSEYDTKDNRHIIVLTKTAEVHPLRCVIENFFNNKIPDRHLAWMITRLLNICCYLKYNNKVCNGINVDNLFVSLDYHSILLLGGLWYATDDNTPMIGTSKDIFNIMTPKVKSDKISKFITDIESVKFFGRQYMLDTYPQPLKDFFNSGSQDDPLKEFKEWEKTLNKAYGERKFIKITANNNQIYK